MQEQMRYSDARMDRTHGWLNVRGRGWDSRFWLESEIWVHFTGSQNTGGRVSLGKGNEFSFGVLSLRCL